MGLPLPLHDPERTAYVVDLSSVARGLFHVLPPLQSEAGEPIAVTAAVCLWLVNLIIDHAPGFLVICADPATTIDEAADRDEARRLRYWRAVRWAGYKAGREPPGPEYDVQISRIVEIALAHRIPVLRRDGIEADDWIGVVVPKLRRLGLRVVIVSGDHDTWQLAEGEDVVIWDGKVKSTSATTAADVEARYGVPPRLMPVLRALCGDGDETPKLKGIGEDHARRLIQKHRPRGENAPPPGFEILPHALLGTILERWAWETTTKGKTNAVGLALRDGAGTARLALELVEMREDVVKHALDLAEMRLGWEASDAARVRRFGAELDIAALRACKPFPKVPIPDDLMQRWLDAEAAEEG